MKRARVLLPAAGFLALVLSADLGEAARRRVYVRVGPPRARVEVRTVAPSPRHVWIGGFHRWDGRAYVWVPGRWELGPRASAVWVPGHWKNTRHGWEWIEGHWR